MPPPISNMTPRPSRRRGACTGSGSPSRAGSCGTSSRRDSTPTMRDGRSSTDSSSMSPARGWGASITASRSLRGTRSRCRRSSTRPTSSRSPTCRKRTRRPAARPASSTAPAPTASCRRSSRRTRLTSTGAAPRRSSRPRRTAGETPRSRRRSASISSRGCNTSPARFLRRRSLPGVCAGRTRRTPIRSRGCGGPSSTTWTPGCGTGPPRRRAAVRASRTGPSFLPRP